VHTALPGREQHRGIRNRQVAGRVRDQAVFADQPLLCGQLASEQMMQPRKFKMQFRVIDELTVRFARSQDQ
jgi:hypothetical protein